MKEKDIKELCCEGSVLIKCTKHPSNLVRAVNIFNKVIEILSIKYGLENEYDILYAYYGKVYSYTYLTTKYKLIYKTEQEFQEAVNEMLETAYKSIEFVKKTRNITLLKAKRFFPEIIRTSTNAIGLYNFENVTDNTRLEEAIELLKWGTEYIENTEHFYVYDTLVRLLIKAGCKTEAYEIVKSTLREYPAFNDFADFKNNKQYNNWLKENE